MKRNFAIMATMAFLVFSTVAESSIRRLTPQQRHYIKRFIEEAASKHRIEVALIRSIIAVESNFNYQAISRVGARGLMQIMPATAKQLGMTRALNFEDPRANILAGSKLLRQLINRYSGNLVLALAAYNAGPTAVKKYGGVPPYRETQLYVRKVLKRLRIERKKIVL